MMAATIAASGPSGPELAIIVLVSVAGLVIILSILFGGRRK